ncbi:DUF998 domain-containing protein [Actinomadura sp. KC345]|uniref:DUF998 domain-containing protein n=1 Tax=Actinomadura sp. KC345 TaxID=2530371 RepID=UPI001FB5A203|nr:DUF998 domain-containing protein [Actinomadura sp. KC345]
MTTAPTPSDTMGPTRPLLLAGTVAGPLFAVVSAAQALLREGFDPLRHAVSQLTLGPGGWVQSASFVLTGLLTIACAAGLRTALRGGRGRLWAPVLVGVQGAGFVAAAAFPADPGNGFPPGSPATATVTATGMLHLTCAGIAFLALIAACFVLASRFSADDARNWAIIGRIAGVLLFVGFAFANTGATGGTLAMFVGAVAAWVWVGASAARLARSPG